MADYIDRRKLLASVEEVRKSPWCKGAWLNLECEGGYNIVDPLAATRREAIDAIEYLCIRQAPTALVEPVTLGRWVEYPRAHYFKCSECKYIVPYRKAFLHGGKREYNYCPSCGVKMEV